MSGRPDPRAGRELHRRLAACSALDLADDLVREVRTRNLPRRQVHDLGAWLVEHGSRREAVKIGLVLIGATGDESDRDRLLLFGSLDEFTLYAVVALVRTQPPADRENTALQVRPRLRLEAVNFRQRAARPRRGPASRVPIRRFVPGGTFFLQPCRPGSVAGEARVRCSEPAPEAGHGDGSRRCIPQERKVRLFARHVLPAFPG